MSFAHKVFFPFHSIVLLHFKQHMQNTSFCFVRSFNQINNTSASFWITPISKQVCAFIAEIGLESGPTQLTRNVKT